jgi:hypothetical protein
MVNQKESGAALMMVTVFPSETWVNFYLSSTYSHTQEDSSVQVPLREPQI